MQHFCAINALSVAEYSLMRKKITETHATVISLF